MVIEEDSVIWLILYCAKTKGYCSLFLNRCSVKLFCLWYILCLLVFT